MTELTTNVAELEQTISREKGSFNLFALFEREDIANRWDLVFAAPWAEDKGETLRYFFVELKEHLKPQQLVELSRIVMLDPNDDAVKAFNTAFNVEHGRLEVRDTELFGLPVKHGVIITSKKAA